MLTLLYVAEGSTVPRERVLIISTVFIFSWCRSVFTTRDPSQWMQFPYRVYPCHSKGSVRLQPKPIAFVKYRKSGNFDYHWEKNPEAIATSDE